MKRVFKISKEHANRFEKYVFISGFNPKKTETGIPSGMVKFTLEVPAGEKEKLSRIETFLPFKSQQEVTRHIYTRIPESRCWVQKEAQSYGYSKTYIFVWTGSKIMKLYLYTFLRDTNMISIDEILSKLPGGKK